MEPDFTGYATKSGIRCADGRTIMSHAFQTNDGTTVPLVWQHQHSSPDNVLGHVVLHSKAEGVRAEGFFNETAYGKQAKALVRHGDVKALSIYATNLVHQAMNVVNGVIKEVSLVLGGANPGALIDFINLEHGDGEGADDEAIIYSDAPLEIALASPPASPPPAKQDLATVSASITHAVDVAAAVPDASVPGPPTVEDVIKSLSNQQKDVVFALIGAAMQDQVQHDGSAGNQSGTTNTTHDQQKDGNQVGHRNVFDKTDDGDKPSGTTNTGTTLSHSDMRTIFTTAQKCGSLREAVEEYALSHGITNVDLMFPDAKAVTDTPDWASRRQEWVQGVLGGTRHTPFARIKSLLADITLDEARARGYVKAAMKREEFFAVAKRVTTPQTIYKKQRLDRDDIVDISDFDVVAWLKAEMRLMLDEEVARAVLIGDGRDVADPDKIIETNVRPILTDSDLYVTYVNVDLVDANSTNEEIVDAIVTGMQYYMGTGVPVLYAPRSWITKMLLTKDTLGRRLHATTAELAAAMGVAGIVPVDVMETMASTLIGVVVNLTDYTIGADRGGEVNFFDDFDIDYNRYTYLYETRLSGALTKFKSALVIKPFSGAGGMLADPTTPTFVKATGVVTIPTMANVSYVSVNDTTGVESGALSAGAQTAIGAGTQIHIRAKAAATYSFGNNAVNNWTFQRPAA